MTLAIGKSQKDVAKHIAQQRILMRKMREVSFRVIHGCEMPAPSMRMLKSRYRAASKLSDLAAELRNDIFAQVKARKLK